MNNFTHYFPQGIALDQTFCNRDKERSYLKKCIEMHQHIVLVAPRRYGKTSLVMQVLNENEFPGAYIDFFFVLTQDEVIKMLSEGISNMVNKILPPTKSTSMKIVNTIASLNPKLIFSFMGQRLEITTKQVTEKSITELLLALDRFARETKKSCVLVLDEFQQIGELKENHAVEAAIRHAVERSQYVSYIFCGSRRHLLNEMFSDKSRPLYHLCDLMSVERIHTEDYEKFLNKMAQLKWKKTLTNDLLQEIIYLTENHPYYINALCRFLWREDQPPSLTDIQNAWIQYIYQQKDWISNELAKLTLNRRKVLTALAYKAVESYQSSEFSKITGLTPSSIQKCMVDLQKMDLGYLDKQRYRLLDPAIAYFIRQHAKST